MASGFRWKLYLPPPHPLRWTLSTNMFLNPSLKNFVLLWGFPFDPNMGDVGLQQHPDVYLNT